jgi:N-acetylmuramic acid 6-phosphate etherase
MNEKANGDTRAAILMILFNVSVDTAISVLNKNNGNFPKSMEELKKQVSKNNPTLQ